MLNLAETQLIKTTVEKINPDDSDFVSIKGPYSTSKNKYLIQKKHDGEIYVKRIGFFYDGPVISKENKSTTQGHSTTKLIFNTATKHIIETSLKSGSNRLKLGVDKPQVSNIDKSGGRYENKLNGSNIMAVKTTVGDIKKTGTLGPRFSVQHNDRTMHEMAQSSLADFLNKECGHLDGKRAISEDVEDSIVSDFSEVLRKDEDKYVYTGESCKHQVDYGLGQDYLTSVLNIKEIDAVLWRVNSNPLLEKRTGFLKSEARAILQHEVGIATSKSDKPILGTYGAGPCIIVAAYNPANSTAMLSHLDALTNISSIIMHLRKFSSKPESIKLYLSGGNSSTKKQAVEVINAIEKEGIRVTSANLCSADNGSKSLAIDSRTGQIFTAVRHSELTHPQNLDIKLQMLGMEFKKRDVDVSLENN